jgi:hypothetical protein
MAARAEIPIAEPAALRLPLRRTTLLRLALGLALAGVFVAVFAVARNADVRPTSLLPGDTASVVVLDLSASISNFPRIAEALRRVAREREQVGLVAFSSGAYELLPPETPARELESFVRFFTPLRRDGTAYPQNPWDVARFRGGTSIPAGLETARYALRRAPTEQRSILLISDLDSAGDPQGMSEAVLALRRDGIELRIVPVDASPEDRAFFERLVGRASLVAGTGSDAEVEAPAERRRGGTLPWAFLLAAGALTLLLTANERVLARLDLRR